MMPLIPARVVLREVDAIQPPADPADYWPKLARCEFCYEDVTADFMNGAEPRQFYELVGEDLIVCGNCVKDLEGR